jgi:hypothetical protein
MAVGAAIAAVAAEAVAFGEAVIAVVQEVGTAVASVSGSSQPATATEPQDRELCQRWEVMENDWGGMFTGGEEFCSEPRGNPSGRDMSKTVEREQQAQPQSSVAGAPPSAWTSPVVPVPPGGQNMPGAPAISWRPAGILPADYSCTDHRVDRPAPREMPAPWVDPGEQGRPPKSEPPLAPRGTTPRRSSRPKKKQQAPPSPPPRGTQQGEPTGTQPSPPREAVTRSPPFTPDDKYWARARERAKVVYSKKYKDALYSTTPRFRGGDTAELRRVMELLAQDPQGARLDRALRDLARLRGRPEPEIRREYEKFLAIRNARNPSGEPPPALRDRDFFGTTQQLLYGKVVGDILGIDPVFGSLLNPTGGMEGPGNGSRIPPLDSGDSWHSAFHDAAGYLSTYHGTGPGYDYITGSGSTNPLDGQVEGLADWGRRQSGRDVINQAGLADQYFHPAVY